MIKYYFTIASILVLVFGISSCSNEETKIQNQITARPEVPLQNGEVRIGNQIWMTKNLNVSRYRNGDPIPQVTELEEWIGLTTGAWCYYLNNSSNGLVYGKLYNGYAVMDPRGLAPTGWHIPNDAEWTTLKVYVGSGSGAKLKSTQGWQPTTNYNGTNSTGFTALPGGRRAGGNGLFIFVGQYGYWWSTSPTANPDANSYWLLGYDMYNLSEYSNYLTAGKSIRCIKD